MTEVIGICIAFVAVASMQLFCFRVLREWDGTIGTVTKVTTTSNQKEGV